MHKVVARVFGGLGNQLFCYAAARRLATVCGAELVIDDVSGFERDHLYRRQSQLHHFHILARRALPAERLEPFSRIRRQLSKKLSRRRAFCDRRYIAQEGIDFDPRLLALRPSGTVYLDGYWQSERYFKDVEETIRDDLRIKPPNDRHNLATATRMRDVVSVAVHVRFFEAPGDTRVGHAEANNAPAEYYQRAIAQVESFAPGAHYFLFSDDPSSAVRRIALPPSRCTVVDHNRGDEHAYADLWLMSQCLHHVIANSTFSWWGAWLAQRPGKHVIAPGFEMRHGKAWWGFDGLLPDEWTKL